MLANHLSHSRTKAVDDIMVLYCHDRAGLLCGGNNRLNIERLPGEHIQNLGGNAFLCQDLGSLDGIRGAVAGSDQRDITAISQLDRLANFKGRAILENLVHNLRVMRI